MVESETTFLAAATRSFDFLVERYGFRIRVAEPDYLRFENEQVYVVLRYDARRSYELGVALGLLSDEDHGLSIAYDLNEVLRFEGLDTERNRIPLNATSPSQLARFLPQLSEFLCKYGSGYLSGNGEKFGALSKFRSDQSAAYGLEKKLVQIREEALVAWHNGEYRRVVELLGSVQKHLTQAEKKKFEIARKRAAGSSKLRK